MKKLLLILGIVMLVAAGCSKAEKLIGTYQATIFEGNQTDEFKGGRKYVYKLVLHKRARNGTGASERSVNTLPDSFNEYGTWKIVPKSKSESKQKEVHVIIGEEAEIYKIEPNGDLTEIAVIVGSTKFQPIQRVEYGKDERETYKRIN